MCADHRTVRRAQCAVALVLGSLAQALTYPGIDSYLRGLPIPYYDSSTMGAVFGGPASFSPAILILDIMVSTCVVYGVLRLMRREARGDQSVFSRFKR